MCCTHNITTTTHLNSFLSQDDNVDLPGFLMIMTMLLTRLSVPMMSILESWLWAMAYSLTVTYRLLPADTSSRLLSTNALPPSLSWENWRYIWLTDWGLSSRVTPSIRNTMMRLCSESAAVTRLHSVSTKTLLTRNCWGSSRLKMGSGVECAECCECDRQSARARPGHQWRRRPSRVRPEVRIHLSANMCVTLQ